MQIDSHVHILRYLNAQNDVLAFVHHFLQLTDFCKQDKYIHTQYHFLHHQCIQLLESYLFHRGVLFIPQGSFMFFIILSPSLEMLFQIQLRGELFPRLTKILCYLHKKQVASLVLILPLSFLQRLLKALMLPLV